MNKLEKYLYHFGIKKITFDTLELWYQQKELDNLVWALSIDDLLIQEKAFKLLSKTPSSATLLTLCDFTSTCSWQLNQTVYPTLLLLLEGEAFVTIKEQKKTLIEQMKEVLASEKIVRSSNESDGRELPSDRLKKIQKDHRHFIGRGLKQLRKK